MFRRRHLLVGLAAGALAIVLAAAVVAPFAPFVQRHRLCRHLGSKGYGTRLERRPEGALRLHRAGSGVLRGSAFLTYAAYGIEYYADVPSLDINQSAQVAPLQPYLQDPAALRAFLLDHGISYALFPLQANAAADIGPGAYDLMSRTALGDLIGGSKVLMTWDGWALYDLAQG